MGAGSEKRHYEQDEISGGTEICLLPKSIVEQAD